MLDNGSSFVSRPSRPSPFAGCSSTLSCIGSGMRSGVTCLLHSGRGGARKDFAVGILGLSSFSSTESLLRWTDSSDGRVCPKPSDVATDSMDLKYCVRLAIGCQVQMMLFVYLDALDLQLQCRIFIHDDHRVRVHLQTRKSPHVVDATFYALLQGQSLVSASDDHDNFPRLSSR